MKHFMRSFGRIIVRESGSKTEKISERNPAKTPTKNLEEIFRGTLIEIPGITSVEILGEPLGKSHGEHAKNKEISRGN